MSSLSFANSRKLFEILWSFHFFAFQNRAHPCHTGCFGAQLSWNMCSRYSWNGPFWWSLLGLSKIGNFQHVIEILCFCFFFRDHLERECRLALRVTVPLQKVASHVIITGDKALIRPEEDFKWQEKRMRRNGWALQGLRGAGSSFWEVAGQTGWQGFVYLTPLSRLPLK